MAERFIQEATSQLAPIYDQQSAAIGAQIPAIQNLYQTLMQGLQGQYDQSLSTGVRDITEDASARGVLRSTLPVDARQALTTSLGQALMTGKGELAAKQAGDVAGINEKLGTLGINRAGAIADLARSLETQDLDRQKFEYQKQIEAQQLQLQKQQIAAQSRGGGSTKAPTQAQATQQAASALARELQSAAGRDGYVSPQDYAAGRREWVAAGFSSKSYESYFSGYKNPQNQNYQYY